MIEEQGGLFVSVFYFVLINWEEGCCRGVVSMWRNLEVGGIEAYNVKFPESIKNYIQ